MLKIHDSRPSTRPHEAVSAIRGSTQPPNDHTSPPWRNSQNEVQHVCSYNNIISDYIRMRCSLSGMCTSTCGRALTLFTNTMQACEQHVLNDEVRPSTSSSMSTSSFRRLLPLIPAKAPAHGTTSGRKFDEVASVSTACEHACHGMGGATDGAGNGLAGRAHVLDGWRARAGA